jgi:hypothetical protein
MAIKYLKVICGTTTCYSFEEHVQCRFLHTRRLGTEWVCGLYFDNGEDILLNGQHTILERCEPCMKEIG